MVMHKINSSIAAVVDTIISGEDVILGQLALHDTVRIKLWEGIRMPVRDCVVSKVRSPIWFTLTGLAAEHWD